MARYKLKDGERVELSPAEEASRDQDEAIATEEWRMYELLRYRRQRASAYIAELSTEGTFKTSVGDLIDAIIKAIYGDTRELDALVSTINDIKSRYPKPE